jgi:hypothetical protein
MKPADGPNVTNQPSMRPCGRSDRTLRIWTVTAEALVPCAVSRLYFETDAHEPCPIEFGGATDVLVYFLSLAFSARYGSVHPLSQLAVLLRGGDYKVDMRPLTTFADRDVEVEADARELARAWQDAAPLVETLRGVNAAVASGDGRITEMMAGSPGLTDRLADLERMAAWAAERGVRVRLSFDL